MFARTSTSVVLVWRKRAKVGDEVRAVGSGLWERLGMERWKFVDRSKQDKEINGVDP